MMRFAIVLFYAGLAAWSVALGGVSYEIEFLVWAPKMITAFFVTGVIFLIAMLLFEARGMDRLEHYLAFEKKVELSDETTAQQTETNGATNTETANDGGR